MKIKLTNSRGFVSDFVSDEEYKFVTDALLYTTEQYDPFKKRFRKLSCSLLDIRDNSMPIGAVRHLRDLAVENEFKVEYDNRRVRPGNAPNLDGVLPWMARTPRPFQYEAAKAALKFSIGIIKASTGSGKTFCGVLIMAATQDIRWVVFCPKDNLVNQWAREYELNLGEKPGIIAKGVWNPQRVTIVTFSQCRANREQIRPLLEAADGFIIDECHGSGAETHSEFAFQCTNAYYRIGMSATPLDRSDKKTIIAIATTGPLIFEISSKELLELGIISKPIIRMVDYHHLYAHEEGLTEAIKQLKEPAAIYRARIVNNKDRNELLVKLVEAAPKPSFLFGLRTEHIEVLYSRLKSRGLYTVDRATEKTPQPAREDILSRMRKGTLDICVTSSVFQDGTDVPNLGSVVVGTGYRSSIAALQRLGRGARTTDTKKEFEVWDIADGGGYGEHHTAARHKIYEREGFEVKTISRAEAELIYVERELA